MHGARPAVLQGGAADSGSDLRAGVGAHQAAVWDRAGSQRQAARCARTTTGAAGTSATDPGETAYLQDQRAAALPKSPLGAAIGYALRNWVALTRYAADGRLKIDNNGAEQALRPIVSLVSLCSP